MIKRKAIPPPIPMAHFRIKPKNASLVVNIGIQPIAVLRVLFFTHQRSVLPPVLGVGVGVGVEVGAGPQMLAPPPGPPTTW